MSNCPILPKQDDPKFLIAKLPGTIVATIMSFAVHPEHRTEYSKMRNVSSHVRRSMFSNPSVFSGDRLLEIVDSWNPKLNGVWYFTDVSTIEAKSPRTAPPSAVGLTTSARSESTTVYRFQRNTEEIILKYWSGITGIREGRPGEGMVPIRESRVRLAYAGEPVYGATTRREEFNPQHHNKWIHIQRPRDLSGFAELSLMNTLREAQAKGVLPSPNLPPELTWAGLSEQLVTNQAGGTPFGMLNPNLGTVLNLQPQNGEDLVRLHDERRIRILSERNPEHGVRIDCIPDDPQDRSRLVHELMRRDFRRREFDRPTLRLRVLWNQGDYVEL